MYKVSDDFIKKIYRLFKTKILPDGLKSGYVRTGIKNDTISGVYATIEGVSNTATGDATHAEGAACVASGGHAHAEGSTCTASGNDSHAQGCKCVASGVMSHAEGYSCVASGPESHAGGYYTIAKQYSQNAIGYYNSNVSTTDLFIIGNGTSESRSNSFRVNSSGTPYAKAALQTSGADYAEFFEWIDYNMKDEDRRGYFVTLEGKKIRIANSKDDYILGIVSSNPVVLGNGDPDGWSKRYLKDEFGNYIMKEITESRCIGVDKDGNEVCEKVIVDSYVLNPDFNEEKEDMYVSRSERQEWSPIGMLGQLIVRDDNTCLVDHNCVVADGGIATLSDDDSKGWRVIERINDHLVRVLFR